MKTKITVKTELEVLLPTLPNFVRTANKNAVMPLQDLTEQQIREIGSEWTAALIRKAADKRKKNIKEMNKRLGA